MRAKYAKTFLQRSNHLLHTFLILSLCFTVIGFPDARINAEAGALLPTQINLSSAPAEIAIFEDGLQSFVSFAGDINGDGFDDIMTHYRQSPDSFPASVRAGIIFGKGSINSPMSINLITDQPDLIITIGASAEMSGNVAGIGSFEDLNGDNIDELGWRITDVDGPGGEKVEANYIMFGSSDLRPGQIDISQLHPDVTIFDRPGELRSGCCAADINGDGAKDIVFIEDKPGTKSFFILFGPFPSGDTIDLRTRRADVLIAGGFELDQFDRTIRVADVNGDGIDDILIGRPRSGARGRIEAGELDIFMGSPTLGGGVEINLSQTQPDVVVLGAVGGMDFNFGDRLGAVVDTGDLNGDGIDDILLGVPIHFGETSETRTGFAGEVYVIFGSHSLKGRVIDILQNQQDLTIRGADGNPEVFKLGDSLGSQIRSQDINGDGIADILIGARTADGQKNMLEDSGEVYAVLGSAELKSGAVIEIGQNKQDLIFFGRQPNDGLQLGATRRGFDFNGDGASEIILAVRKGNGLPSSAERVDVTYIYFGGEIRPPEIKKAKFKKASSKLVMIGTDFTGASQIEINGVIIDREVKFVPDKSRLILKGNKRDLNLNSGQNQVRVIRKEARSNTVTLKL